ncbi:MAG TPA: DUF6338 family protein [Gemmatimonadaceae bacterium]|jgi:hypothetical protein|nr:DUF6338 family protein [Gemmatimonadaceae bacterium]
MGGLSLLAIVYLLVPGFIADTLFRTIRGIEKGEDLERVLRSLVWSVFGLSIYLLVMGVAPEYVAQLAIKDAGPTFTRSNLLQLALHAAFSMLIAAAAAKLLETAKIRRTIQGALGKTLAERLPWDFMWLDESAGRKVRVVRKGEKAPIYWGYIRSASTGSADKELLLREPAIEDENQIPHPIGTAHLLYIPGSEIAEIRLAPTKEEADAARRQ